MSTTSAVTAAAKKLARITPLETADARSLASIVRNVKAGNRRQVRRAIRRASVKVISLIPNVIGDWSGFQH